ncbi:MAG: phosphatidate cytidylyltransferase [Magnetococcales bacterium]|nr:phosphatidate cytidylyltransferase [Magnetococcales bacterium]MBF0172442.1 phosphatidate cytidylyltransferase [Magnetococcales bacterium]MBF0347725.1 phosphatidate cytidylyltransferase [Magnetococcales bacterium]MBF0631382.1 phosphatidate cytidylyltransferase [Magnetococcales bacterium]
MIRRILSSVVLIPPLLLLLLFGSSDWFFALLLPVSAILLYEWHAMVQGSSRIQFLYSVIASWLLLAAKFFGLAVPLELLLLLFLMLLLVLSMPRYPEEGRTIQRIGYHVTGVIYCIVPLILLLDLHHYWGGKAVLFLLLVIWATDSGALVFGKWLGQRRFAARISPGKTVTGFWGGLAMGVVAAMLAATWMSLPWQWGHAAVLGLVISFFGQMGDLAESMLKREAGVKDSGRLIPGHGGMLDRLDSLLFAAPVFFIMIRY